MRVLNGGARGRWSHENLDNIWSNARDGKGVHAPNARGGAVCRKRMAMLGKVLPEHNSEAIISMDLEAKNVEILKKSSG